MLMLKYCKIIQTTATNNQLNNTSCGAADQSINVYRKYT